MSGWGNIDTGMAKEKDIPVDPSVERKDIFDFTGIDVHGKPVPIKLKVDASIYADNETYQSFLQSVAHLAKLPFTTELLKKAEEKGVIFSFQDTIAGSLSTTGARLKDKDGQEWQLRKKKVPEIAGALNMVHELRHLINGVEDINYYPPQLRGFTREVLEADSRLWENVFAVQMAENGNPDFIPVVLMHTPATLSSVIKNKDAPVSEMLTEGLITSIQEDFNQDYYKADWQNYVSSDQEKQVDLDVVLEKITYLPESMRLSPDQKSYNILENNADLFKLKAAQISEDIKNKAKKSFQTKLRSLSAARGIAPSDPLPEEFQQHYSKFEQNINTLKTDDGKDASVTLRLVTGRSGGLETRTIPWTVMSPEKKKEANALASKYTQSSKSA